VAVRVRPLETEERRRISRGCKEVEEATDAARAWSVESGTTLVPTEDSNLSQQGPYAIRSSRRTAFQFDAVFDEDASTSKIYSDWVEPLVDTVVQGRHATVFSYGQTGSGKTYTMQGEEYGGDWDEAGGRRKERAGLIQMAAKDLFEKIRSKCSDPSREYFVKAQYFEVYNETIRDLLVDHHEASEHSECGEESLGGTTAISCSTSTSSWNNKKSLKLLRGFRSKKPDSIIHVRDDLQGNPVVNAYEEQVHELQDVLQLLEGGNKNRSIGATYRNERSSRSHTIFRLTVRSHCNGAEQTVRHSALNLVDLAGSENSHNAASAGIRRREGGKINQRSVFATCAAVVSGFACLSSHSILFSAFISFIVFFPFRK